jgi:hypothetical protein
MGNFMASWIDKVRPTPLSQFFFHFRPRKHVASSTLLSGDDPYLVECVTEKMFPHLSIENSKHYQNSGHSSLQLVTLREGDKSVTLPYLSVEQNYSQMLSELVMQI